METVSRRDDRQRRERVDTGIYQRTDATGKIAHEIGYRDSDGVQRWQRVEGGVRAARTARADVLAKMGRGERVAPSPKLTFGQAAERWQKSQAATLRASTRETYASSLSTHLLPRWSNRRLDSIGVDDVARMVEEMQTAGKSAWTIRGCLTVVGRIFDYARRRCGWAGENPVRLLDRSERPSSDQKERRVLTGEELQQLLASTESTYRPIFYFAASTGARLGEVLGIRWGSLDLERGTASLTHQLDRTGGYVKLKTKRSRRTIEIPDSLVSMLREHKISSEHSGPDDYVFTTKTGTGFDHRNVAGRALSRAVKAAEIVEPTPSFHSFRHGFASSWIAAGGDLVELSAHLGHADPAITASVYAGEFEKASRSDARRDRIEGMMAAALGSIVEANAGSSGQSASTPEPPDVALLAAKRSVQQ